MCLLNFNFNCWHFQGGQAPGVGEILASAESSSMTTQCSETSSLTSDSNDDRRRNSARRSSSSCVEVRSPRSRGADNVCVTVNTPRANGAVGRPSPGDPSTGGPSPGDCNDLKNVLFLAEHDSDHWDSESCSEDEGSVSCGSDSDLSDSYTCLLYTSPSPRDS